MTPSSLSSKLFATALVLAFSATAVAQEAAKPNPQATEVWAPVPPVVTPGATGGAPGTRAAVAAEPPALRTRLIAARP